MNSCAPTVSVVIPTYNRAGMVGRAIRSVLAQTFKDWELIVADDGSVDDTVGVIESFQDSRIHLTRHERNRGACAARNTGAQRAKGEFLTFLDSDSKWLPEKLERQVSLIRQNPRGIPNLGVVLTGRARTQEGGGDCTAIEDRSNSRGDVEEAAFLRKLTGGYMTALMKKEVFFAAGMFDERLPACQDWDLCVRLAKVAGFDAVDGVLYVSYQHDGARVHTRPNTLRAYRILFDKYKEEFSRYPRYHAALRCRVAAWCLMKGRRREAFEEACKAVAAHPRSLRPYAYVGMTLLGPRAYERVSSYQRAQAATANYQSG